MPTDMVGCIRRSLESPLCSVSSCSSSNSYKQTRSRSQLMKFPSSLNGSYDAYSEESDAESAYRGMEKFDHPAMLNSDNKSLQTNNGIRDRFGNMSELAEVNLALGNHDSEVEDSLSDDLVGTSFISDYLAYSDSVIHGNNGTSSVFSDGEENMCNFFLSFDSQGFDSSLGTFRRRTIDDMEDVEVSSTASMSSILGRFFNMDLDDQSNYGDSKVHSMIELFEKGSDSRGKYSIMDDQTRASSQYDVLSQCSVTDIEESHSAIQAKNEVAGNTFSTEIMLEIEEEDLKKEVIGLTDSNLNLEGHVSDYTSVASLHHNMCMEADVTYHKGSLEGNGSHICSIEYEDVPVEDTTRPEIDELQKGAIVSNAFTSVVGETSIPAENERISGHQTRTGSSPIMTEGFEEHISPDIRNQRCSNQPDKPRKRSLLNTVVTGTTLVGVFLFWLHTRKGKEKTDKPQKAVKGSRVVYATPVSQRGQSSKSNGIYPSEKLKLGS